MAVVSARDVSSLEARGETSWQTPEQITDLLVQLVASRYEWNLSQYLSNSSSTGQRACPVAQKWLLASSRLQNTFLRLDFFFFFFLYSRKSFLTKATEFGDVSFWTIMVSAYYVSGVKASSPQVNIYLAFSPCEALLWLLRTQWESR